MIEHTVVPEENGARADKIVLNACGEMSYAFLQKIFRIKKVKVNDKYVSSSDRLSKGDIVRIFLNEMQLHTYERSKSESKNVKSAEQFKQMIIFENENLLAINKPTNLSVQMGSNVKISVETLMKSYRSDLKLAHRIDKDTSGILLIAKGRLSAQKLTKLFRENKIKKTYLAVVDGKIKSAGVIDNFLRKSIIGGEEKIRISTEQYGRHAVTKYFPKRILTPEFERYTLLKLCPQTGRKHQLRVHCADALHAPILGDKKYNANPIHGKLFLHAYKLSVKELGMEIIAAPPKYFPNDFADFSIKKNDFRVS